MQDTPPEIEPIEVRAEAGQIKTAIMKFACPKCQHEHVLLHVFSPRPVETLAQGGELLGPCERCRQQLKITMRRVVLGGNAPLPRNRHERLAQAARLR